MRFRPGTPVAADGRAGRGAARRRPRHRRAGALLRRDRPGRRCRPSARPLRRRPARWCAAPARSTSPSTPDGESALARVRRRARRDGAAAARRRRPCGAPGTATSRRSPPTTSRRTCATSTSTTSASTWCRSTTGGAPGSARGCGPRRGSGRWPRVVDEVRASGRRAGIWLAPFLVGRGDHAGPRAPGLAGRAGRPQLGPGPRRPRPHPPRRPGAARSTCCAGWSTWASTTSSSTSCTPARCPVAATRTSTRWRPTARGWRWSARWSDPTSTSSAAARRSCRASAWSTPCGSRPDTFHEGGEDGSTGLRGLMPLAARAWQQGRFWVNDPDCVVARPSYSQRERWARGRRAVRRAALVLGPGRRARRLGAGHGPRAAGRRRPRRAVRGRTCSREGAARRPGGGSAVSDATDARWPRGSRRTSSCSTPTSTSRSRERLVALAEAYASGCAAAHGRAADPPDRLPDHLRRRHPAAAARRRCTRWRRSCTTTSATWSATCTCCRCSRGPPTTGSPSSTTGWSTRPWAPGTTSASWPPTTG